MHLTQCLKYISSCDDEDVETRLFDTQDRDTEFSCKVALLFAVLCIALMCQDTGVIAVSKVGTHLVKPLKVDFNGQ